VPGRPPAPVAATSRTAPDRAPGVTAPPVTRWSRERPPARVDTGDRREPDRTPH